MGASDLDRPEDDTATSRTWPVLLLLVGSAAVLSFLVSYALSGVLIQYQVIGAYPIGSDPRPRWMAVNFCILLSVFGLVGAVARSMSQAQLRRIDAMAE
jgi:uncharacterized membrane protein